MKFRERSIAPEAREEILAALPKKGDRVKILGGPDNVYIVDEIGLKIYRLHVEGSPAIKKSAFKKDVIRIF